MPQRKAESLRRIRSCGAACPNEAPKLTWNGQPVAQFANLSAYAEKMLMSTRTPSVKVREDMPFNQAALIGCGVTTGVGAALNTAKVEPGSSVAVFGAGGVGLSSDSGRSHRRCPPDHRG